MEASAHAITHNGKFMNVPMYMLDVEMRLNELKPTNPHPKIPSTYRTPSEHDHLQSMHGELVP